MKFALVQFNEGKKGKKKYLVETRLIKDFHPASALDFVPQKEYQIKWQDSFYGDDGDGHNGCYPGEILVLGASEEEVKYKAREKNIRLPSTFPVKVELPAAPIMKKPLRKAKRTKNNDDDKEFEAKKKRMERTLNFLELETDSQELVEHSDNAAAAGNSHSEPAAMTRKRTKEGTLRSLTVETESQELFEVLDNTTATVSSHSKPAPVVKKRTKQKQNKTLEVETEGQELFVVSDNTAAIVSSHSKPAPVAKKMTKENKCKSLEVETESQGLSKHYSAAVVSSPSASAPVASVGNHSVSPSAARTLFLNGSQHTRMLMSSLRLHSAEHGGKSLDGDNQDTFPLKRTTSVTKCPSFNFSNLSSPKNASNLVSEDVLPSTFKMPQRSLAIEHREFTEKDTGKEKLSSEEEKSESEPYLEKLSSEEEKKCESGPSLEKLSSEEEEESKSEPPPKKRELSLPVTIKKTPQGDECIETISSQSQVSSTSLDTGDADITEQLDALKKVHHQCFFKIAAAEREKNKANGVVEQLKSELNECRMIESKLKSQLEKSQMMVQKLQGDVDELKELNINIQRSMLHSLPPGRGRDSDQTSKHTGDSEFVCKKGKMGKNVTHAEERPETDMERKGRGRDSDQTSKRTGDSEFVCKKGKMGKNVTHAEERPETDMERKGSNDLETEPSSNVSRKLFEEEDGDTSDSNDKSLMKHCVKTSGEPHSDAEIEDHESDEEVIINRVCSDLLNKKLLSDSASKGKVYLGSGVSINENLWVNKLRKCQQDSIFVKDVAQGIWGVEGLKIRTAEKPAPNKTVATPSKVKLVKAVLKAKLQARNAPKEEKLLVLKKYKTWLGQKMYETHRAEQKKMEQKSK